MKDLFEKIDSLTLDKSELYVLGRFCRAFLEKAPVITEELFPFIESSVDCQKFQSKIMRLYTENHENERRQILCEMKERASHPDVIPFYAPQLDEVNKKLEVKTFLGLLDSIEDRLNKYSGLLGIFNNSYKNIHGSEDSDYIRNNYKYYYIGSLLYGSFESIRNRTDVLNFKYSSVVFDEYQRIGLDIKQCR